MKWVRAQDGALFGVCKGMARTLSLPVGIVRLLWLCSILFMGTGVLIYVLLGICLPREDKVAQALEPMLLGVCSKIAVRSQLEVGVVRFLSVLLALFSFGATIVGYIVLYFVMDNNGSQSKVA